VSLKDFSRRIDEAVARRFFQLQSGLQVERPHDLARLAGVGCRRPDDRNKKRNADRCSCAHGLPPEKRRRTELPAIVPQP
jgi:hypothetical protein